MTRFFSLMTTFFTALVVLGGFLTPQHSYGQNLLAQFVGTTLGMPYQDSLRHCEPAIEQALLANPPDTIIVLGAGFLDTGEPGKHLMQRVWAAKHLYDALPNPPLIIVTGGNPRGQPQYFPLEALRQCGSAQTPLTEAKAMCSWLVHLQTPPQNVVLERRAHNTRENAQYSSRILRSRHIQHALIITTPVVHPRWTDLHARRALKDFRDIRGRHFTRNDAGYYRLSSVSCPFENGGPSWMRIEQEQP